MGCGHGFQVSPRGHRKSCRRGGFREFWLCEMPRRSCRGNHRKVQGPVRLGNRVIVDRLVAGHGLRPERILQGIREGKFAGFYANARLPSFLSAPGNFDLPCTRIPMVLDQGRFGIDFDALGSPAFQSFRSFYVLPSAQPRWQRFYQRGACQVRGMGLPEGSFHACSDEIHCDLLLEPGLKHTPLASLGAEVADRSITLMAPSKTTICRVSAVHTQLSPMANSEADSKKRWQASYPILRLWVSPWPRAHTVPENLGGRTD